jgi:hypothetical protein
MAYKCCSRCDIERHQDKDDQPHPSRGICQCRKKFKVYAGQYSVALYSACKNNDTELVKQLLYDNDAYVGAYAFRCCFEFGHIDILNLVIEKLKIVTAGKNYFERVELLGKFFWVTTSCINIYSF